MGQAHLASFNAARWFGERFIEERRILNNISPATIQWYRYGLRAVQPALEVEFESIRLFRAAVISRIGELQTQGRGNKDVSSTPTCVASMLLGHVRTHLLHLAETLMADYEEVEAVRGGAVCRCIDLRPVDSDPEDLYEDAPAGGDLCYLRLRHSAR